MRVLVAIAVLGVLACAKAGHPKVKHPLCDFHEAQAAALISQDYINAQHVHGYKYTLKEIEKCKFLEKPDGVKTLWVELDLLETKCHVQDPTPVANCTVRPKPEEIEADCDVVLTSEKGVQKVQAFKCKNKPEPLKFPCVGCPVLLPLNDNSSLKLITDSLAVFNNKSVHHPDSSYFDLLEVGRLTSQVLGGGAKLSAEFIIVETNCTVSDPHDCVHVNHTVAKKGFCTSEGNNDFLNVNCYVFEVLPLNDGFARSPHYHHHHHPLHHPGHGFHKMIPMHDPFNTGLLSESTESP